MQLQPMFADDEARIPGDFVYQVGEVVTAEELACAAGVADEQVLVALGRPEIGMTSAGLMHARDEVEFFQFFERAVDGDQPKAGEGFAGEIVEHQRAERSRCGDQQINERAQRGGDAVPAGLQPVDPDIFIGRGRSMCVHVDNENHYQ